MATEKTFSYILPSPSGVPGGKNYQTVLNLETGATVTYDVTAPFQRDAVLKSEPKILNGQKIYSTEIIPVNGNTPDSATEKYLLTTVATEADKQRANLYKQEAPKTGSELEIPGAINTATEESDPTYSQAGIGQTTNLGLSTALTTEEIIEVLGDSIVYPTSLRDSKQEQDFIKFTLIEYGQRKFQLPTESNTESFKIGKRDLKSTGTSVYLPIQPSINDQNDVGWGEDNMNVFKAVLANIATTGSGAVLGSELDKVGELFGGNSEYGKVLRRYFGGQAVGINPLSRTDGLVLNPNLELLFTGPSLRPFNFTFRLSPRDSTEATNVKKIIKFFKIGSTVRTTNDGLFLKAPYVFDIAYKYKGKDGENDNHPGLNRIKTCALRTISVNYTPDGSYMTFEDGTMTSYEISLQFSELEPVYDTDQKDALSHAIGY